MGGYSHLCFITIITGAPRLSTRTAVLLCKQLSSWQKVLLVLPFALTLLAFLQVETKLPPFQLNRKEGNCLSLRVTFLRYAAALGILRSRLFGLGVCLFR